MRSVFKAEWINDPSVDNFKAQLRDIESQESNLIPYSERWKNVQKSKWLLRDSYFDTPAFDYALWRLENML